MLFQANPCLCRLYLYTCKNFLFLLHLLALILYNALKSGFPLRITFFLSNLYPNSNKEYPDFTRVLKHFLPKSYNYQNLFLNYRSKLHLITISNPKDFSHLPLCNTTLISLYHFLTILYLDSLTLNKLNYLEKDRFKRLDQLPFLIEKLIIIILIKNIFFFIFLLIFFFVGLFV